MRYRDLREFLSQLENREALTRIAHTIDPYLEMTEISDRVLRRNGPALLFEAPKNHQIPVLTNLFGTVDRILWAMGKEDLQGLRELGVVLASLKEPTPPSGLADTWKMLPLLKQVLHMAPSTIKHAPCQEYVVEGDAVDLTKLPIQTCWPLDAGPLITWGLVITQGVVQARQNLGIYRMQVIGRNQLIMRWLAHRGGALDYQAWVQAKGKQPFPVVVALGADPATTLAAVTPIPDTLSEYAFAGLLRGGKTQLANSLTCDLAVPATAEIILEGYITPGEEALEGPFGDHTGYYNEAAYFPVFTVTHITHREKPLYHSTYTGRPPDEPAMLAVALNELLIPLLQRQFPEIVDFYLPPEGCSYRMAVVTMRKQYPGHAKRVMFGVWSYLRQFMYTKFIIVTDADVDARNWQDVIWAITSRMDPARDLMMVENTPIDYLDFASPEPGLGSKIGFDATHKWPGETARTWGKVIEMEASVKARVDALWQGLKL